MSNAAVINATHNSGQLAGSPVTIEAGGDVVLKAFGSGSGAWSVTLAFAPSTNESPVTLTISNVSPSARTSVVSTGATSWVGWVQSFSGEFEASGVVEGYQPDEALAGDLGVFIPGTAPTKAVKAGATYRDTSGTQYTYSAGAGWSLSSGVSVYTDFTTKADGPITGIHDDSPLQIRTYYPVAFGGVPLVISGGRLKSEYENPGQTACYTETDLGADATAIGADISFKSNGGNQGTIALCLWGDSSLVDTYVNGRIPQTGCHFIIGYSQMQYQIWDDNGSGGTTLVTLETIRVPELPRDGTLVRVNVAFDGDTATIQLPEYGFRKSVTDPRIKSLGRRYACWETLQQSATIDQPQYGRIWASSEGSAPSAIAMSGEADYSKPSAIASALSTDFTITTSATETDSALRAEIVIPPSGNILAEYTALLAQTAAAGVCLIEFRVTDSGGGNVVTKSVQVSTTIVTQQISARAIITGLPAGARRFVRVYAYLTGSAAAAIKRSTAGSLIPVLTSIPL